MQPFTVTRVRSGDPNGVALRVMGETARRAADTFTVREWMARIAKTAGPKDYREQLRRVFGELTKRWRYIMETGEWVHGTPRSLLAHVLGCRYNPEAGPPERSRVWATPADQWSPGWGDCDDIATLGAACVLGLGLVPLFRVSRGPGGAHVAVTAQLPSGELVQLDPVVWPERGYNWAPSGPDVQVEYYDLHGTRIHGLMGAYTMPELTAQFVPMPIAPGMMNYAGYQCREPLPDTYVGELRVGPYGAVQPYQHRTRLHVAAVPANDTRGERVIAVPGWHAKLMRRGLVWHGTPGVDQFGQAWNYHAGVDAWLPREHPMNRGRAAALWANGRYYGKATAAVRAERKARRRRTFERVKRGFQKVGQFVRKVASKILNSKFVQTIVAGALQVFGVPMKITKLLMTAVGGFVGKGGFIKLLKMARKSPKEALKWLAQSVQAAGKGDLLKKFKIPGFSGMHYGFAGYGYHGVPEPSLYRVYQDGGSFYGAPISAIVGLPGVYEFGQAFQTSDTGEPGRWYRVKYGDGGFLNLIKRVYGTKNVAENAKMVINAAANRWYLRDTTEGWERNYLGPKVVIMNPVFYKDYADVQTGKRPGAGESKYYALLWFPTTPGDEPPELIETTGEPEPPPDLVPDAEPVPPTPVPVPADDYGPDEPETMPPLGPVPGYPEEGFPDAEPAAPTDDAEPAEPHAEPGIDTPGYDLKPIQWPDEQPANDGAGPALAAGIGLLLLAMT